MRLHAVRQSLPTSVITRPVTLDALQTSLGIIQQQSYPALSRRLNYPAGPGGLQQ